jgi:type IV pilus assembly protein PilQ
MRRKKKSSSKMKIVKCLLIYSLVLVMTVAMAVGGAEQGPVEAYLSQDFEFASASVDEGDFEYTSDVGASAITMPGDIATNAVIQSISFRKDWSIRDALSFLAARYQKNIVPSAKVDGLITVTNLYNVTFEEALEAILGHGFKYEHQGNFIKVYTAEEYKSIKEDTERMESKIFTLYYITAAEAKKLITPVLSKAGAIQDSTEAKEGISAGKEGVGGDTGGNSMALHDIIVVYDYPEKIDKIEKLIALIDVRPQQVLIEATILSATLNEGMEFGIDWNLLKGTILDGTSATQDYVSDGTVDRGSAATTPITQLGSGVSGTSMESSGFAQMARNGLRIGITSSNLIGFITALETVTDITILANPKILALNKQAGTVLIGQKIGYRDRTSIDSSGTATVGEVSFLETGTKLSFRPYIGNDGYIRMEIYPQDSSGDLDAQGIPTKTTAELTTNIMVKDGETIVIGGLFRDAVTSTRSQIPLLGDLPLIGAAFRGTTDSNVRQEVIVMLTPHIVREPKETLGDARAADIARKRIGAKDELQWVSRTRLVEDRYAKAVKYYLQGDNESAMRELTVVLNIRPSYLEAIRLKERIIAETRPGDVDKMERIMLEVIDQQEASKWRRW